MTDLPPLPETPLGRYRHYKGGEYEVVGVARHSETLEPLVLYRPLYNASGLWVRPHAMFFESGDFDGRWQPRFTRVTPIDAPSDVERCGADTGLEEASISHRCAARQGGVGAVVQNEAEGVPSVQTP